MSANLLIEKQKIKYFPYETSKKYRVVSNRKGGIFDCLNVPAELAEDVTFGDLFKFLIKEKDLVNLVLRSSLYRIPFEFFIADFKRKPKIYEPDEVQFLEIYWNTELHENNLFIRPDFHGIGKCNESEIGGIAIYMSAVCELKNYVLKLNETLEIRERFDENNKILVKAKRKFTLYEIIQAIFYQFTWFGTPQNRDKVGVEMLEEIKNGKTEKYNSVKDLLEALKI